MKVRLADDCAPCTVRLLGCDVAVVGDSGLLLDEGALGEWLPSVNHIMLASNLDAPNSGEALVHEVIETANSKLELDLKHRQIQALGAALYQFIRDNPAIVKLIVDGGHIPPLLDGPRKRRR